MKRALAVGILFAFVCGQCAAQEPPANQPASGATGPSHKLTLKEAEALALRNNPQITIGKLRSLEAREYVREKRSALLPTASRTLRQKSSQRSSTSMDS